MWKRQHFYVVIREIDAFHGRVLFQSTSNLYSLVVPCVRGITNCGAINVNKEN